MFLSRHSAKQLFFYLLEKGFAECIYLGTRQSLKLCRVPDAWTRQKSQTLPSARRVALGKEPNFAEGQCGSTRQSSKLRRVLPAWHSAKFESLPSATCLALGKVFDPVPFGRPVRPVRLFVRPVSTFFAECGLAHGKGLPSAREKALGKAGFAGRRKAVCVSPSATLGKEVAECFSAFAECL